MDRLHREPRGRRRGRPGRRGRESTERPRLRAAERRHLPVHRLEVRGFQRPHSRCRLPGSRRAQRLQADHRFRQRARGGRAEPAPTGVHYPLLLEPNPMVGLHHVAAHIRGLELHRGHEAQRHLRRQHRHAHLHGPGLQRECGCAGRQRGEQRDRDHPGALGAGRCQPILENGLKLARRTGRLVGSNGSPVAPTVAYS